MVNILVVGTGAVGAFYGSRLHQPDKGTYVSVTCRSNYAQVKADGLSMETHSFGAYHFSPQFVFPNVQEAADKQEWDYVVVATKALPDVADDSLLVAPLVDASRRANRTLNIVLIQNGLGFEKLHTDRFGRDVVVLSAVTVVSAEQTKPGTIKQNRWTRISVGPYLASKSQEEAANAVAKDFVALCIAGGIADAEVHSHTGIQFVRWHKLAINSAVNPSAVLSGGTTSGALASDPEIRRHLAGCMDEIFETAPKILGEPWPEKLAKINAEKLLKSIERNTGGKASMLLDWTNERPLELEVILGIPIRIAREHGIEMERLQSMYALLKMAVHNRDQKSKL